MEGDGGGCSGDGEADGGSRALVAGEAAGGGEEVGKPAADAGKVAGHP